MRRIHLRISSVVALTLVACLGACGGDDDGGTTPGTDAGGKDSGVKDASVGDTGGELDATADSGTEEDAGNDAEVDATVDGRSDAATDAAANDAAANDAGSDAATDASTTTDAGADADAATPTDAGDAGAVPTVLVVRLGNGTDTLGTTSAAVELDEYPLATGGARTRAIALPTAASGANVPFSLQGTATSEGALARSVDGRYVTLAGYAAAPGIAGINGTPSSSTDGGAFTRRVVARVDAAGVVDTSTQLEGAFSGNSVRSTVTTDGTAFWVSGTASPSSTGGVHYVAFGSAGATTQVLASPTNVRHLGIFGGQLYFSSSTGTYVGVSEVGTGLPTTAGQTATLLTNLASKSESPYSFALLDLNPAEPGLDTLYVADDRPLTTDAGAVGGVQKWTLGTDADGGKQWTRVGVLQTGLTAPVRGLTARATGTSVTIVVTTSETTQNNVEFGVDDGVNAPTFTVIATAPANTVFRGVAFPPSP